MLNKTAGIGVAAALILLWALTLAWNLSSPERHPLWVLLMILVQTHLYTGMFITAHDAMHGTVAPGRPQLNRWIGSVAAFLFMFNYYPSLLPRHHAHHRHVGTDEDPDFHRGNENFFLWFRDFLKEYITWQQVLAAAITFNVAGIWIAKPQLVLYWIVPSFLSLLQLFYFGTWLPHRGEHENRHHARSQPKNHFWAFISCYFFGYHYEHHEWPGVPWWKLWQRR